MRIDAFRGLRDPITFDLSSPITLIYAPNGAGKTTLCEAAEWLLTGRVERLRDGKDFDQTVLKSKFIDDDRNPMVDARIIVAGKTSQLVRSAVGSNQETKITELGGVGHTIRPHDLLSILAPAAAAQEAHHLTAIKLRQQWLHGTRFLSAEALAALVDSDDETIERRTQIFADLLGIRHLLDAEKLCERFINDLGGRERSLAREVEGQAAKIASLTAMLSEQTHHGSPTTSAAAEVETAETKLRFKLDERDEEPSALANRIEAVNVAHARRQHVLSARISAIEAVAAEWNTREDIERDLTELTAREAQLALHLAEIENDGRVAARAVTEATNRQERDSEHARVLTTTKETIDRLIVTLTGALACLPNDAAPPQGVRFGELSRFFPEAGWTAEALEQRQADLHAALESQRDGAAEARRLDLLKAELEPLARQLLSEDAFAELRAEAARLGAAAVAARQFLEATSDPIARLQAAARDLLEHSHVTGTDQCPLCSHRWGSHEQLHQAIAATLGAVPELTQLAHAAATSAGEAALLAKVRLDEATQRSADVARLRRDVQNLESTITSRRNELDRLGGSAADPPGSLAMVHKRLATATALSMLLRERERVAHLLSGASAPILSDETPVEAMLDQFGGAIAAREQVVQFQLATTAKELEARVAVRDQLRSEHAVTQQGLHDCRQDLTRLRPELARLQALWERAAPGLPWSNDALVETRRETSTEMRLLAEVAAHAAAAQAAWSVELRRVRLEELNEAIRPQQSRLQHLRDRVDAARRAKATFHDTYNKVSRQQIEDMSRVVNPLFARMHANRVFDKIRLGQVSDPLRWLADAGTQELDPGKDFSQGQRQDLALALFLARARSLGGTFFLDEPVTHLDDLNRVGLLDIFRATVMQSSSVVNLVITTASKAFARHMIEKFSRVDEVETPEGKTSPLRVIELDGNGRTGVTKRNVYPQPVN
jgi:DNA repair exonuclease SbcCD ATPase subunit